MSRTRTTAETILLTYGVEQWIVEDGVYVLKMKSIQCTPGLQTAEFDQGQYEDKR